MKKIAFGFLAIVVAAVFMSYVFLDHDGQINVAGYTGAPGEGMCNTCHGDYALNTGGSSIGISAPGLAGWVYTHNQTYTIHVTVAKTGDSLFGVSFVAVRPTDSSNAGTLVVTNAAETQIMPYAVNGHLRYYLVHTGSGNNTLNSHTFTFDWTAPANIGSIKFYAAGLAANADGTFNGDYVDTVSQLVTQSTAGIKDWNPADINLKIAPNPAAETCAIEYTLAVKAKVAIELIDTNGRVVKSYFNKVESAGKQNHIIAIDKQIAKGVYYISVEIGGEKHLKKLLVAGF